MLFGEGRRPSRGERLDGGEALRRAGLAPSAGGQGGPRADQRHAPDGRRGGLALRDARRLLDAAVVAAALSLEAFKGSTTPFDARLHELRRQPGQTPWRRGCARCSTAAPIVASHADCGRVQDPYTLRCIPQVLGAIADALDYVDGALERELDAVTDNPLLFPDDGDACSGGNFHGQPLSLPLDHLALAAVRARVVRRAAHLRAALAQLRRAAALPHAAPGPQLGPDDRPVRAGRAGQRVPGARAPGGRRLGPDLGGHGGLQLDGRLGRAQGAPVVENAAHVVAIELACACQGIEFHRPLRTTPPLEAALAAVRERVPRLEQDRSLSAELTALAARAAHGRAGPRAVSRGA